MKYTSAFFLFASLAVNSQNLLIKNTSFENELYGWDYGVLGNTKLDKPVANFSTLGTAAKAGSFAFKVSVEKSFERSGGINIYLIQDRLKLKKNRKYKVSFYVKSSVEEDIIYVASGSGSGLSERRMFIDKMKFKGDNKWKKLEYTFTAKSLNDKKSVDFKNSAIYFGFNFREGEYFIDDVKVEQVEKNGFRFKF